MWQNNKYLKVDKDVVITPECGKVIYELDPYFINEPSIVSSCLRTRESQFEIIRKKAVELKIDKLYNEFQLAIDLKIPLNEKIKLDDYKNNRHGEYYYWQWTWSKELNLGAIINPPHTAEVLLAQFRLNKQGKLELYKPAGRIIQESPHFSGKSFDIRGEGKPDKKHSVIMNAKGKGIAIKTAVIEWQNNCCHVDII